VKILIDAHMVGERETGNERYVLNLSRALCDLDLPAEFIIAATDPDRVRAALPAGGRWRIVPITSSSWRRLLVELPRLAAREDASLLHVTYTGPWRPPCPLVVTVHDVSYARHPEWFSLRDRLVLSLGVKNTLSRAAGVITISRHARSELCAHYKIPEARVLAAPLAADPLFRVLSASEGGPDRLAGKGVRFPYVLGVGNLQPRKNLPRLVAAFARAKRQSRLPHQLVLAGKAQWRESEVFEVVRQEGIEADILFTGYLSDGELVALYNGAEAFAYPSLYEGFGLPVLEAMACGTPVISSHSTSIPEVAGDAAVLIAPTDTDALADALVRVLSDRALRADLRERGLRQAERFSWRQTAMATWAYYQEVAGTVS
jgi:glycosyltransferase involved in cell wall biosynthesis